MGTTTTIASGDRVSAASPAQIPCVLGCSAGGVVGGVGGHQYVFNPGDDVAGVLKGGIGADAVLALLAATNGQVNYMEATPTWSPAPAVTKTGTGPTVTCSLAASSPGCYDDQTILMTVKVQGTNGAAQLGICYDGVTELETVGVPLEPAPHLIGTADLTALTLSTLNAQTVITTVPALTVTFVTPTSIQNIADQINTQAIAGSTTVRAQISQNASGAQFLDLYLTAGGSGSTLTLGNGTANTNLGFTNGQTTTGAAAILTLPFTGLKFTFPSGTYNKGDTYKVVATGPRASVGALSTAQLAAKADYRINPFGFFVVAQPSDTHTNCAGLEAQLSTSINTWRADPNDPIFVGHVVGSPFHVASNVLATNDTNIATADAALIAAFLAAAASFNSVAVDDSYIPGAPTLRGGTFRRTAALAWAIMRAKAAKLAADVGDGVVPSCSLLSPDGQTRARDEARATTKLGGGSGPGFSVLHATSAGLSSPKFSPGATRAGAASRLRYSGVYVVANEIARLAFGVTEPWEAQTWQVDPLTKQIEDGEKGSRIDSIRDVLKPVLLPDQASANCSTFDVQIDNSGPFLDTGKVPVKIPFIPLGEVESVTVAISATGTVSIT